MAVCAAPHVHLDQAWVEEQPKAVAQRDRSGRLPPSSYLRLTSGTNSFTAPPTAECGQAAKLEQLHTPMPLHPAHSSCPPLPSP